MQDPLDETEKKDDGNNDEQNCDIDFVYNDADDYTVEIAELYSYSEEPEFLLNRRYFEEDFSLYASSKWCDTNSTDQRAHISRLLDRLDSGKHDVRQKTIRSILYLLQGNFGDCQLDEDQIIWARRNVYLCLEAGLWPVMVQILLFEINYDAWSHPSNPTEEGDKDEHKSATTSMAVGADLRAILSILYIIVETVWDGLASEGSQVGSANTTTDPTVKLREQFCEELSSYVIDDDETTLTVVLLGMVNRFCNGSSHFPIKKVLLLLWKILLITLGPITSMFARKNAVRARWNLPPLWEDTHQVIRRVRANSPPANSADQILSRPRVTNRHIAFGHRNQAPKQGSLANGRLSMKQPPRSQPTTITSVTFTPSPARPPIGDADALGYVTPRPGSPTMDSTTDQSRSGAETPLPVAATPDSFTDRTATHPLSGLPMLAADYKVLRWKPKVRIKDLEAFLTNVRLKFVKFQVPNDTTSLIGLPEPIHEAVRVLREHLYTSLSEVQIKREQDFARNPVSMGREVIPDTAVERLYRAVYPLLPQYMVALLRVLLAALPTSRAKVEPINILAEILPENLSDSNGSQRHFLNFDIDRHREIIVKAISALLLLLLKHFKLNHIYQFEYVSQYLVFANCIPLILKFFNQNISNYVYAKNSLPFLDFPARFIGEMPELNTEMLHQCTDWNAYSWRNLFACINLLRILNMLTKWKHSRTMLLVVFKSAPILKRILRVRHAMLQLYALKLLKLQSRYFGRQWRKNNMSIMSAIYQKVRHRLTDDWAYGNDMDAVPWRFQLEEHTLRASVDQFNQRRYTDAWLHPDFKPLDNCLTSVLSHPHELSDEFKRNYEKWLEEEVFSVPINWSQLLTQ